jgi:hypothetical protein
LRPEYVEDALRKEVGELSHLEEVVKKHEGTRDAEGESQSRQPMKIRRIG